MRSNKVIMFALLLLTTLSMVSCSEDDGVAEEFYNWQEVNEIFFSNLSTEVKAKIKADPTQTPWKRIKSWSESAETEGKDTDYILVYVKESAPESETQSPVFTDSASVHYQGNLLPSKSYNVAAEPYALGYRFDASYQFTYDADTSRPVTFAVGGASGSSLIEGFSTALQHMRRGDHWVVYIPHQLGYGINETSSIPPFSTLVFEIRMVDFW